MKKNEELDLSKENKRNLNSKFILKKKETFSEIEKREKQKTQETQRQVLNSSQDHLGLIGLRDKKKLTTKISKKDLLKRKLRKQSDKTSSNTFKSLNETSINKLMQLHKLIGDSKDKNNPGFKILRSGKKIVLSIHEDNNFLEGPVSPLEVFPRKGRSNKRQQRAKLSRANESKRKRQTIKDENLRVSNHLKKNNKLRNRAVLKDFKKKSKEDKDGLKKEDFIVNDSKVSANSINMNKAKLEEKNFHRKSNFRGFNRKKKGIIRNTDSKIKPKAKPVPAPTNGNFYSNYFLCNL